MIARLLFRLARHPAMGALVGWGFALGAPLLPVRRVRLTPSLLVFHHPRPAWPLHLLLVPRRRIPTLLHLVSDPTWLSHIMAEAQQAAERLNLLGEPWVLCANGGPRQEVGQVHFHLFSRDRYAAPTPVRKDVEVWPHPSPAWELHLCLRADTVGQRLGELVQEHGLLRRGYTLVYQHDVDANGSPWHLIAGKKTDS